MGIKQRECSADKTGKTFIKSICWTSVVWRSNCPVEKRKTVEFTVSFFWLYAFFMAFSRLLFWCSGMPSFSGTVFDLQAINGPFNCGNIINLFDFWGAFCSDWERKNCWQRPLRASNAFELIRPENYSALCKSGLSWFGLSWYGLG